MIRRHQLAVCPRITSGDLARAGRALLGNHTQMIAEVAAELREAFAAHSCLPTDSGTSALALALRVATAEATAPTVALPGFGCVDFASAVEGAGVKVRLYDVDPNTLSPDLESLERALRRGVDAAVVAHYYGYAADVRGAWALASAYGVPLIEDAAQAAGGTLDGVRLGSLGDLSVLSFGRGKGLFGGRGGALMAFSPELAAGIARLRELAPRRGVDDLLTAATQWLLGRPRLYALPASLPWLHLGEMVYHPAHEPEGLSAVAASLVRSSLAGEARECATRRRNAAVLRAVTDQGGNRIVAVRAIPGAKPGYLRFATLDRSAVRQASPRLGVMRAYPRTLDEQPEMRPHLRAREPATPGAAELRASLFTLPTHSKVTDSDLPALRDWIRYPLEPGAFQNGVARRRGAATTRCGQVATNRYAVRHSADPAKRGSACGTKTSVGTDGVPASCECAESPDSAGRDHHL